MVKVKKIKVDRKEDEMNHKKEEIRFLGYAQALEDLSIAFAQGFERDKPDTPEKVHEMIVNILDEKRISCIRRLGYSGIIEHPIWTV